MLSNDVRNTQVQHFLPCSLGNTQSKINLRNNMYKSIEKKNIASTGYGANTHQTQSNLKERQVMEFLFGGPKLLKLLLQLLQLRSLHYFTPPMKIQQV